MKLLKVIAVAGVLCLSVGPAVADNGACERAWDAYNALKERSVMEPDQYRYTEQGRAVREACGPDALPVPKGADTPHRPIRRPPPPPPPPPPPEGPPTTP